MMNNTLKTLILMLAFALILCFFTDLTIKLVSSEETRGKIDIFTQKEPFSGKGLNTPSDAFHLEEEVKIYASVTYRDFPVAMASVAFEIHGPENPVHNITFYDYDQTDDSGIARISFRIGLTSEINFGEWTVYGSVYLADEVLQDLVSFNAGWIVEIVSLKTIDEDYAEQANFLRRGNIGVELAVQNIAMTEKNASITIAIHDISNVSVNSTQIDGCKIPPNGTIFYVCRFLTIPRWTSVGSATVSACVYTAPISLGGIPYSPKVSKNITIAHRDLSILNVKTSPTIVYKGETVNINVIVKNEGKEVESFNASVHYNETNIIAVAYVPSLKSSANVTLEFGWNTSNVSEGFYQISAYLTPVPGEVDEADNIFEGDVVEVRASIHDVAILNVTPSSDMVYIGEVLDIQVKMKNKGTRVESLNVTVYFNSSAVETLSVYNLIAGDEAILVFHWDIHGVAEGNYLLSAFAKPVEGEEDVSNNSLEDGIVEVTTAPTGWFVPCWLCWLLLLLLILITILLIIWLYRRRRQEEKEAFRSGWTAWYYGYDIRDKTHKPKRQRGQVHEEGS